MQKIFHELRNIARLVKYNLPFLLKDFRSFKVLHGNQNSFLKLSTAWMDGGSLIFNLLLQFRDLGLGLDLGLIKGKGQSVSIIENEDD